MRLMQLIGYYAIGTFQFMENLSFSHIEKSQGPLLKNLSFGHSPPTHAPLFDRAHRTG